LVDSRPRKKPDGIRHLGIILPDYSEVVCKGNAKTANRVEVCEFVEVTAPGGKSKKGVSSFESIRLVRGRIRAKGKPVSETILNWFNTHESIGIWVEAIALVGIFIWDRIDGNQQHRETLEQLEVSRKQVEVTQEQVEASHKPCLVLSTTPRAPEEAILGMGGTDSAMIILCPQSQAQLENIGNGPAINARYNLTPTNPTSTVSRPSCYLVTVLSGKKIPTPIPRGILQGNEWEIILTYESLI
jgi:hypothetical protein